MPIADTPLEQVLVLPFATKCTLELTDSPFEGLLTTTVANAGAVAVTLSIKSA